jgi:hypothetical protein
MGSTVDNPELILIISGLFLAGLRKYPEEYRFCWRVSVDMVLEELTAESGEFWELKVS